jgi:hypothetical protein
MEATYSSKGSYDLTIISDLMFIKSGCCCFLHKSTYLTVIRQVSLLEQERITLPEYSSSFPVGSVVHVAQS